VAIKTLALQLIIIFMLLHLTAFQLMVAGMSII
jgi:hypothetical protein